MPRVNKTREKTTGLVVRLLDLINESVRSTNKKEKEELATLLRSGYAYANFEKVQDWEDRTGFYYPTLDDADVLLAFANLIEKEGSLPVSTHESIEKEYRG